jgi:hypothetical protein
VQFRIYTKVGVKLGGRESDLIIPECGLAIMIHGQAVYSFHKKDSMTIMEVQVESFRRGKVRETMKRDSPRGRHP